MEFCSANSAAPYLLGEGDSTFFCRSLRPLGRPIDVPRRSASPLVSVPAVRHSGRALPSADLAPQFLRFGERRASALSPDFFPFRRRGTHAPWDDSRARKFSFAAWLRADDRWCGHRARQSLALSLCLGDRGRGRLRAPLSCLHRSDRLADSPRRTGARAARRQEQRRQLCPNRAPHALALAGQPRRRRLLCHSLVLLRHCWLVARLPLQGHGRARLERFIDSRECAGL